MFQPTDLSDPNPVQMLMLCVHLHEKLPQYLPIHTISLSGSLHSTFTKQVRLKNPSSKPLKYKASLFGEDAHLFSLPDGSTVSIPPKSSSEVSLHFRCSFLHPMEAVLLFTPTLALGRRCSAIAFALKTQVTHILPAKNVKCKIPCYQLAEIQVPILNTFNEDATFRVVLLESTSNPLKSETITDSLLLQGSSKDNLEKIPSDGPSGELAEEREDKEFLTSVTSVYLKPRQESTLIIHHLPFCPGTKFCSVLLKCPQVGDLVYLVKATSEPPLPSPLSARPSSNIIIPSGGSDRDACVPVLILRCEVGRPCEEVLRLPRVNMQWEQALAIRGQWHMGAEERRRRTLTHTLHSSSVRTGKDQQKLWKPPQVEGVGQREVQYQVEVSLPQHFTLPPTVTIPVEEDTTILWGDHADCDYVDVPMRFQADLEGKFSCKVVLRSSSDTRVYLLEALVTSQTQSDSLRSGCEGAEQVLPVRGAIERPLPVEHVVLHCPLGRTTHTQLEVPNSTLKKLTLKVLTDLSVVSGPSSLEVPAGLSAAYSLAVSPWRRGAQTGYVSFVESGDIKETGKENGNILRCYVVNFSLEILCEPAEPVKVIHVQCETRSSVAIAIPIYNPMGETLRLDVDLDGDDLSGSSRVSLAPRETLTYTATFTPSRVGRSVGSVVFQSLVVREFWYQLQLSALPPPLLTSPQSRLEVDPPVLSVVSPLCRIPVDDAPLAELQCEVGQRLEKEVQVWLTGAGNQGREEDFLCEVRSDGKEEECLSASVQAVRTDPETETLTLILQLVYTPHRAGRSCGVLAVRSVSGEVWEFPVSLSAVEPQADDIILMEATKLGTTSTVAFRLTSTTRSSESFTAAFLPGSSSEFRVSPASGLLPPAGTSGALLRVSFTPSASSHSHRAMLAIQAADMRWIYEVKGETSSTSSSTQASSDLHHPSKDQNFVVGNLQLPSLANSSPLKVSK